MTKSKAQTTISGIKGFDSNLACKGFQFKVGETYTHAGAVVACKSGFHAITEHPLAVFDYYAPAGSRFCKVDLSGKTDTDDRIKTAAEVIKIGREIGLSQLTQDAVQWVISRTHPEGERATGVQGAASATGDQGAASATGVQGAASATGYQGAASATGVQGAASATGDQARVRGSDGNAIFTVEREGFTGEILSVACGIVGKKGLKAMVCYRCEGGKLVVAD